MVESEPNGAAGKIHVPEVKGSGMVRKYLLREYGAWSVMILSYLAGLFSSGKPFEPRALIPLLALSSLMNSKQAFTRWIRKPSDELSLAVFSVQIILASIILIAHFGTSLTGLLPFIPVPLGYLFLLKYYGEHFMPTEITGFAVLALSSLMARFTLTGVVDIRIYLAVAIFFIAGVFKVRLLLRKGFFERLLLFLYVALSVSAFDLMEIPVIILLPLADNLVFDLTLYKVKLRTAGWVEAAKGVLFVILITLFFNQ